jgi:hypothetical protein
MEKLITKHVNTIVYFYNPYQMPFERFFLFQKYAIMESGIGSDMNQVGKHFQKLHQFLGSKMIEEARKEAENLHFNIFSILNNMNYVCKAVAVLVSNINDKAFSDLSDEGINTLTEHLMALKLTPEEVQTIFEEVKKKII